jgi:hypothetical protein
MAKTDLASEVEEMGRRARRAARALALCSTDAKNAALQAMADAIEAAESEIVAANAKDLEAAPGYGLNAAAIRSGKSFVRGPARTDSKSPSSACPSAWSASFTNPGPT